MVLPRIWVGCAAGENAQQGIAITQGLISDLRKAGADVVSESFALPDEQFLPFLQQELMGCQWFVLVQTPQGMGSRRVQLAIQEALSRLRGGLLCGACLVSISEEGWDEPAPWLELRSYARSYAYNGDYPRLRDKLLLDLGLLQITGLLEEEREDTTLGMLPPVQEMPDFHQQTTGSEYQAVPFQTHSWEQYKPPPFHERSGELYKAPPFAGLQQMGSMASQQGRKTKRGDQPPPPPFSIPKPPRRFWLYGAVSILSVLLLVSGVVLAKGVTPTTSPAQKSPVAVTHLPPTHSAPTQVAPTQPAPTQPAPTQGAPAQPTSNVLAQDTFQRGNQAHWGTASDGQTWSLDGTASPALSIVNGTGQIVDADPNAAAGVKTTYVTTIGPSAGNVDVEASAVVNQFATGAPTTTVDLVNFGVVARWQNNNMYKALIDGQQLYIFKYINDNVVRPPLASVPFAAQGGVAYTIRFEAVGAILQAKVWPSNQAEPGNWMVSVADNSYPQGQGGLRFAVQPGTQINVISFQETAI
jgi:hypothetical protein